MTYAETFGHSDLIVVDGIDYLRTSEGIKTSGGHLRISQDWTPLARDLSPRKFAYALPSD